MSCNDYYEQLQNEFDSKPIRKNSTKKPLFIYSSPIDNCQCCKRDFFGVMYDARLPFGWGNYCAACFKSNGGRTGQGYGQRYDLQEIEKGKKAWVKTDG